MATEYYNGIPNEILKHPDVGTIVFGCTTQY